MRTTLTIDDDVLAAVKDLASRNGQSLGEVISGLARQALDPVRPMAKTRNGILLLPDLEDGRPVDMDLVNQLRDERP